MSDINNDAADQQLIDQDLAQADNAESNNQNSNRNLTTPGRLLRTARENKELAISSAGKQLKLDVRVIEALERDDFDSIGAPVFVKGHLRKYASFVGLDPDDVMLSYYQVARTKDATPIISQTMPMTDARPKFAWVSKLITSLVVLALVAALIYAIYRGWNWYLADAESGSADANGVQESSLSLPGQSTDAGTASNSVAVNSNTTDTSQVLSLPPQNNTTATTPEVVVNTNAFVNGTEVADHTDDVSQEVDEASSATANPSNVTTSATTVDAATGDTLRLVFLQNCWVNIKGGNGRSLMNGIGYQGDSREFVLTSDTEIHLGNADGVQLFLNGQAYQVPRRARSGKTALFQLVPRN